METTSCCNELEVRAMLAGSLSPAEEERIAAHLQVCPACERLTDQIADDSEIRELLHQQRARGAVSAEDPSLLELRERLVAMARLHEQLSGGAGGPAGPVATSTQANTSDETLHARLMAQTSAELVQSRQPRLGPYQIERLLGAGAFAAVYLARDDRLGRHVALKLPRTSVLADPDLKQRFLREAEALARLDHPQIVPVFEAGEIEGTCYLAIAYCAGPTLAEWLQSQAAPVPPRAAAQICLLLADAVAHAHERQILHRDIKPSNILLDCAQPAGRISAPEGGPLEFTPRLTDFGLAKIAEQSSQATLSGTVLGTPQYMAPEQAAGHAERIGPATDIYSLGAVLYELLTGQAPIVGNSPVDTLRRVLIDEPLPVRRRNAAVPEDLAAIAAKCLDKSPGRRYAKAAHLADDLRRFLDHRPTLARPLSPIHRGARWVRRHPAWSAMLALAAVVVALLAGIYGYDRRLKDMGVAAAAVRAKSSRLEKQVASSDRHLETLAYVNDIRTAAQHVEEGDLAQAAALLRRYVPAEGQPDRRSWEWHYLWTRVVQQAQSEVDVGNNVYQLRLAPSGNLLAAACQDGSVRLYDPITLALQKRLETGQGEINGVAFDDRGELLASAGDDGTVKVWRLADGEALASLAAVPSHAYGALFLSDGQSLVTFGREATPRVWQWRTGQPARELAGHGQSVEAAALSPNLQRLVTASSDMTAVVWDATTLEPRHTLSPHTGRLSCAAFSPDGQLLATGSLDRQVYVFDTESGRQLGQAAHLDAVQSLAFSGDGQWLISGDRGGTVRRWRIVPRPESQGLLDLRLAAPRDSWHAHDGRVWSLAAIPGSELVISAGEDGRIRRWSRDSQVNHTIRDATAEGFIAFAAGTDPGVIFVARHHTGVSALDSSTGAKLYDLPDTLPGFWSVAVLGDRQLLAAGTSTGQAIVWDLKTRQAVVQREIAPGEEIEYLTYSPRAGLLAAQMVDCVRLLEPATLEVRGILELEANQAVAFSPDGMYLAADTLNQLAIFELSTCRELRRFPAHRSTIKSLAWSPDGSLIASASVDRTVKLWTPLGDSVGVLSGHRHPMQCVAFSADGKSLFSADKSGIIRVSNVATRRELLTLPTAAQIVKELILLPGGRRIAFRDHAAQIQTIGVRLLPPAEGRNR